MRARRLLLAALAAGALLGGCGGADEPAAGGEPATSDDPGPIHIHGLGVNPADGSLMVAAHTGLWRSPPGEPDARRVADVYDDLMGFTVTGPDRFLASGHPDAQSGLPPQLGLRRSDDAGRTWESVSLLGEADLHVLRAAGDHVYGVDSGTGALLASEDGGRSWDERTTPAPVFDLVPDPDDPERLVAATEKGMFRSADGGRTWRSLDPGRAGLLAWPASDRLYLVEGDGSVSVSADGGRGFRRAGSLDGPPEAFAAAGPDELYAALHGGHVVLSEDGGATWTTRVEP